MIKLSPDWVSVIIAAIALAASIVNMKRERKNQRKIQELDKEKEKSRQRDRKFDKTFTELNSRSGLIAYLHLILNDSKIETIEHNGSKQIKVTICLMNIGKESAVNICIYPMRERGGLENFFETVNEINNSHFIHDYLNRYFALPQECITFSMIKEIPKENDGKFSNFVRFKIRFCDLLGNLYEQTFQFGYDNYCVNGFNRYNFSSVPKCIEKASVNGEWGN